MVLLLFKYRPLVMSFCAVLLGYDFAFLFPQDKINVLQKKLERFPLLSEGTSCDFSHLFSFQVENEWSMLD